MSDDKKVKRQALALLKKVRRWLRNEDRLVTDWHHIYENARGKSASPRTACRVCIMGAVPAVLKHNPRTNAEHEAYDAVLDQDFEPFEPHTLKQVHRIYDRAIARLEKELRQ